MTAICDLQLGFKFAGQLAVWQPDALGVISTGTLKPSTTETS